MTKAEIQEKIRQLHGEISALYDRLDALDDPDDVEHLRLPLVDEHPDPWAEVAEWCSEWDLY